MTNRIECGVHPQRQAYFQYLPQDGGIKPAWQKGKIHSGVGMPDISNAEHPRQEQCGGCGNGNAGNAHSQPCCQYKIQRNIDGTGNTEQHQRGCAVAQSAQDARVEVIAHIAENAQRRDAQVGDCIGHSVGGNLHQLKQKRPGEHAQQGKRKAGGIQEKYLRLPQPLQPRRIGCPCRLRNQDGNSRTDAEENTEQNFQRLGTGRHGG